MSIVTQVIQVAPKMLPRSFVLSYRHCRLPRRQCKISPGPVFGLGFWKESVLELEVNWDRADFHAVRDVRGREGLCWIACHALDEALQMNDDQRVLTLCECQVLAICFYNLFQAKNKNENWIQSAEPQGHESPHLILLEREVGRHREVLPASMGPHCLTTELIPGPLGYFCSWERTCQRLKLLLR